MILLVRKSIGDHLTAAVLPVVRLSVLSLARTSWKLKSVGSTLVVFLMMEHPIL